MRCQNCGQPAGRSDIFCSRCGHLVATSDIEYGTLQVGQRVTYASLLDVLVEVPECRVVPGETARFPFVARGAEPPCSIHEFSVFSENPDFNPGWVHIVKATDGMRAPRYTLEIRPVNVRHSQYGTYPIWIRWDKPGVPQPAIGRCTLVIKPCVRLKGNPTFKTWPGGVISLTLENCGGIGIDISVSITHHGSSWSNGWEFELETGDGPFKFKETFDPPADGRGGEFTLDVSAAGIPLIHRSIRPNNFGIPGKHAAAAAVVLIGAAVGITLANVLPSHLVAQSISFTSQPSGPAVGARYLVSARGGGSGNPVTFTVDSPSAAVCSLSGPATVAFNQPGSCVIDANQAGNDKYQAALQAQQKITVSGGAKTAQSISFTSQPSGPAVGARYLVSARGGGSGNPVTFTVDSPSAAVCSLSGPATVAFNQPGSCVIDANQAGNDKYQARPPGPAEDHRVRRREDGPVDFLHVPAVRPGRGRQVPGVGAGRRVG